MFRLILFLSLGVAVLSAGFTHAKENYQKPGPVHFDKKGEKWARESLKKMSLEQKVGQMFMVWSWAQLVNVDSPEYAQLRDTVRKYHLGGLGLTVRFEDGFLYKNEPLEAAMVTNQLQKDSAFPLIFAADFERGLAFRLKDVTDFPHAMAFGATGNVGFAREAGRITAQEARAIGVQWNWFPVADVNSNPQNPIINTRAFGEDPKLVADMVTAYIQGAHEYGMLTTVKHFPGHGDTDTDSHSEVPIINRDRQYFDDVALPPFRAGMQAGVDAVMVAHVRVPALDADPNHVATISPAIVTGLLKQQMGFQGLVVTDALLMQGLTKLFPEGGAAGAAHAAVAAVKAGNDMLLLPSDLDGAYNGVLRAVRSGEIPQSQIDQSVLKILKAKATVGLNKAKLVDITAVPKVILKSASVRKAQEIADRAVTLVRNNGMLPLKATTKGTNAAPAAYTSTGDVRAGTVVLIFTDDTRADAGRTLEQQVRIRVPGARTIYLDPRVVTGMTQPVMDAVQQAQRVIIAAYAVPEGGKVIRTDTGTITNTVVLPGTSAALLHQVLVGAGERSIVVAMGSPYMAAQFPEVQTYLCTFSTAQTSEISAVKAIFGEIPMPGRLPVTIPNIANRGAGLGSPTPSGGKP